MRSLNAHSVTRYAFLVAGLSFSATLSPAQTPERPERAVTDPGVVTTRQAITPAGIVSVFQGRVYGLAWAGAGGDLWVLHASDVYRLDWKNNRVQNRIAHAGTPGNQAIFASGEDSVWVANSVREGGRGATPSARLSVTGGKQIRVVASGLGSYQPGAFAVSDRLDEAGTQLAAVPLVWEDKLAVLNLRSGEIVSRIPTGIAPFAAAIRRDGKVAYVSNLGGRPPRGSELFAAPMQKPDEKITVDARGIASTGTVTRIDLERNAPTHTIAVGLHPTALALDPARNRLYVANGNGDSISVVDTIRNQVIRTLAIQPFEIRVRGIAPTAIALSADGKTLFVACGGINAVAVLATDSGELRGLIPTGWYPNGVALDPGGKHLAVSSLLGAGSGWRETPAKRFVHAYRGSVAVLPLPDSAQLASYTTAVAENNHMRIPASGVPPVSAKAPGRPNARPAAVPARSGEPSPIQHVVYIIKENRTYDQVLGDVRKGNGDRSLVMFGQDVTPNQHRLAEQFVLLDNFFATGGNSGDGHQWVTQANETEYCLWPGYQGRSYPFDGTDPMAYSSGGFIWDYALARGRTVKVYGEYAGRMSEAQPKGRLDLLRRWESGSDFTKEWSIRAPLEPLNRILASHYPSYTNAIPDVVRAGIFLSDLKKYEAEGKFPNLVILQLPCDHTFGTSPGTSSPKAMVADNDLALGQIIEGLSKSPFWAKMAVFVVEDDAQNGVDHVDGHRTTAFVASPYARRGHVDSTFYSHQSMLKTIELMLGLPTMSLFDLIANDMRNSFTDQPDLTPYTAVQPKQDLYEINPPASALSGRARSAANASARMNWSVPDAVPTDRLNRILWGNVRGWSVPYPGIRNSIFAPLAVDIDDDERE